MNMSLNIPWRKKKKVNTRKSAKPEQSLGERIGERLPSAQVMGMSGLFLCVATAFAALWVKAMDPQTLPIKQVQLEAPFNKVSKEKLYEVVQPNAGGGFFNVDVDAVTAAVEALPWVEFAAVRRVWPDSLNVSVRERIALARWQDQALVSMHGELFFPDAETFPGDLIELRGPKSTVAQMAQQFKAFKETLDGSELDMVSIRLTPRRAWSVQLANGATVVLGRNEVNARLQRFVEFYPRVSAQMMGVQHVDMRYTNGFAVKWQVPAA